MITPFIFKWINFCSFVFLRNNSFFEKAMMMYMTSLLKKKLAGIQKLKCLVLILVWCFSGGTRPVLAGSVPGLAHTLVETIAPVSLDQMATAAGKIVIGRCLSATPQTLSHETASRLRFPGTARITEYVFQIEQTLKGQKHQTLHFKQLSSLTGIRGQSVLYSMPTYEIGQDYLLFLTQESEIGLCSPVGLFQGAFRLQREPSGQVLAINGNQNLGLFTQKFPIERVLSRKLTPSEKIFSEHRKGPLPVATLILATCEALKMAGPHPGL